MSRGGGWVKNLKMVSLRVLKPLVLDLAEKALKIHPWWKHVFSKNASVEFILCDFIKKELHHRIIWHVFCKVPSLMFWKTFFKVSLISFIQEVMTLLKGLGIVS